MFKSTPVAALMLVAATLWLFPSPSNAYSEYSTEVSDQGGCATCHGAFRSGEYESAAEGINWGDHLHNVHLNNTDLTSGTNGSCDNCHGGDGVGNSRTVKLASSGNAKDGVNAIACMGCHGRLEDQNTLGPFGNGWGAGLRQHHENSVGAAGQCVGCHQDSSPDNFTPAGEDTLPPWYASVNNISLGQTMDPCSLAGEEFFSSDNTGLDNDGDHDYDSADADCGPPPPLIDAAAAGDNNSNGAGDIAVLLRDENAGRNFVYVMDGSTDAQLQKIGFGPETAKVYAVVPDVTGDGIPDHAVLVEGSLFARVKNGVGGALVSKTNFDPTYEPVAMLAPGDVDGDGGQDLAVVGRDPATGSVQVQVKRISDSSLVSRFNFDKNFTPIDAVVVDNFAGSAANEIAVFGVDSAGRVRVQIKDASTGNLVSIVYFDKTYEPLDVAFLPNPSGTRQIAVLGKNASGVIRAQIKDAQTGNLVALIRFDSAYEPFAFFGFNDSNADMSNEVTVVGVDGAGKVRAQTKEVLFDTLVSIVNFDPAWAPVTAIPVKNIGGTGQDEIAVMGENGGQFRLQVKDLRSGSLVNTILVP